jgi:hypothetical protein
MATFDISKSGSAITINNVTDEIPGKYTLSVDSLNEILIIKAEDGTTKVEIHVSTDTVNINGDAFSGTAAELKTQLLTDIFNGGAASTVTVYQLKTILTDAQIKALPTTGISVVPAPGANKLIVPISAFVLAKFGSPYTVQANSSFVLMIGGNYVSSLLDCSALLSSSDDDTQYGASFIIPWAWYGGSGMWATKVYTQADGTIASRENQPLILKDQEWGVEDYTGGDPANTMEVTVFYSIVDL